MGAWLSFQAASQGVQVEEDSKQALHLRVRMMKDPPSTGGLGLKVWRRCVAVFPPSPTSITARSQQCGVVTTRVAVAHVEAQLLLMQLQSKEKPRV